MRSLSGTLRDAWRRLSRDAIDFVYARSCVRCKVPLPAADERFRAAGTPGDRFCPECYALLSCAIVRACARCGAPVGPYLDTSGGCRHCRRDRFQFERVFALGAYEGELRECCMRAKQAFEEPLTAGLTDLLWEAHSEVWRRLGLDLVVPIPHHWTERLVRRHLPATTISRVMARRLMVPVVLHILSKSRRTPAQSSLTPARRRTNLQNAFRIAGRARLDGLTILLADDILTTGATADRAAQVLRHAGARAVYVAVLARGIGRN
jgi:predicted amidophosphoribosyltransferase